MKENFIYAPIDNKNLMEDAFEDDVFADFYAAHDHRDGKGTRHFLGMLHVDTDGLYVDGFVDVKWKYGGSHIVISLEAVPPSENIDDMRKDCYEYYTRLFKSWECPENENLVVNPFESDDKLYVRFYFRTD